MAVVTTVMPVYNGEPHLAEALDSLARQRRQPDRVVVLDDGSTDRTREIVTGFKGLHCEYRLNEQNLGLLANHNRALELATETDYLHFLHQDDVLLPDFCARTVEVLNGVAGRGMSWGQAAFIDEQRPAAATDCCARYRRAGTRRGGRLLERAGTAKGRYLCERDNDQNQSAGHTVSVPGGFQGGGRPLFLGTVGRLL